MKRYDFDPKRMRYWREKAGLTLTEMGYRMGYNGRSGVVMLSRYEVGEQTPSIRIQRDIAAILGVDRDELCSNIRDRLDNEIAFEDYLASGSAAKWCEWYDARGVV